MSQFSVSVKETKREFAGNRFTTIALFKIKPLNGGPTLSYQGNATGDDFMNKCERLKRQPTIIDDSILPPGTQHDYEQRIVRLGLDQTAI